MNSTRQKIFLAILVASILTTIACDGYSIKYWARTYSWNGNNFLYSVQQTKDDGYFLAGLTTSGGMYADVLALKLDNTGNILWQKTYGGKNNDYCDSIQQTSDGGYILGGSTSSFGAGNSDFCIIKLKSDGEISWQKAYGNEGYDYCHSIQQTSDGGYLLAGDTAPPTAFADSDAWVLKIDKSGNIAWQKIYVGSGADSALSVQQTSDGGYILAGQTDSFGDGSYDFWLLKLDSNGNIAWQKTYGDTSIDLNAHIKETTDGGYSIIGSTRSSIYSSPNIWMLKLDNNGNIIWQKQYKDILTAVTPFLG